MAVTDRRRSRAEGGDAPRPRLPAFLWADIFVLVDHGHAAADDYPILERMVLEQGEKHPGGLGGLVIIPSGASPPPEEVRRAIREVITNVSTRLRCLCWLVEGAGFRAAAVRATLIGLRVFGRQSYATHVASDITEAVGWILRNLEDGMSREQDLGIALDAIQRARESMPAAGSSPRLPLPET
ncbi:MAG TPA: hypothetical protein VK540_03925 [Polyangiaceae bacterium]|jgi:hypothetical protein|nr:hypothetical protein [Polyangiaceae bacterium]